MLPLLYHGLHFPQLPNGLPGAISVLTRRPRICMTGMSMTGNDHGFFLRFIIAFKTDEKLWSGRDSLALNESWWSCFLAPHNRPHVHIHSVQFEERFVGVATGRICYFQPADGDFCGALDTGEQCRREKKLWCARLVQIIIARRHIIRTYPNPKRMETRRSFTFSPVSKYRVPRSA